MQGSIHFLFTDTPPSFEDYFEPLLRDTHELGRAAFEALEEEAIPVAVRKVYHSAA